LQFRRILKGEKPADLLVQAPTNIRWSLTAVGGMGEKLRKQIARWTRPAILGTVIGSAAMNAFAFAAQTSTAWMTSAAITLGIATPTLVYALMRRRR
jgi:hypothetical protein